MRLTAVLPNGAQLETQGRAKDVLTALSLLLDEQPAEGELQRDSYVDSRVEHSGARDYESLAPDHEVPIVTGFSPN